MSRRREWLSEGTDAWRTGAFFEPMCDAINESVQLSTRRDKRCNSGWRLQKSGVSQDRREKDDERHYLSVSVSVTE